MADAAWATPGRVTPAGIRLSTAALAGGGAGLAVLVLSFVPGLFVAMFSGGLIGPVAGFLALGVVCGLAAGYTGRSFSEGAPVLVALGAWAVWTLAIVSLAATKFGPTELGWATLPAGLVGALAGAGARGRGAARRAPSRLLGTGLLGALGAFAVLTLGIAALGYAAQFEWFRFRGATLEDLPTVYNAYQRGWEAALWAVIILAAAVSAIVPVVAAGGTRHKPVAAAALALVLFLAFAGLTSFVFNFYVACSGIGPLPPFVWLYGSMSC